VRQGVGNVANEGQDTAGGVLHAEFGVAVDLEEDSVGDGDGLFHSGEDGVI